jgi:hypothetical protein
MDSLSTTDEQMAGFMAWRLKFRQALETADLRRIPLAWREHVRVYQTAWVRANQELEVDPRAAARSAVRAWLEAPPG